MSDLNSSYNMDNVKRLKSIFTKAAAVDVSYKRFGRDNDGGYIMVNDITKNDFGISFGIAGDVSWDQDFMKFASGIHMYDNSIDNLPEHVTDSKFFKETVGSDIGLDKAAAKADSDKDLILKMDIEGSEIDVLKNCSSDSVKKFRQIIIEFHNIIDYTKNKLVFKDLDDAVSKILQTHLPVWLHANNWGSVEEIEGYMVPDVLEVLFLRKSSYSLTENFSVPGQFDKLDMPNRYGFSDIQLFLCDTINYDT
jgi:hypothetical protein